MKGTRVKLFAVSESALLGVFGLTVAVTGTQEGVWTVPSVPFWPEGASFCPGVSYDWITRTFRFRVQHESFPLVEEGKEPEIIRIDMVDKVVQVRVIPPPMTILASIPVTEDKVSVPIGECVLGD